MQNESIWRHPFWPFASGCLTIAIAGLGVAVAIMAALLQDAGNKIAHEQNEIVRKQQELDQERRVPKLNYVLHSGQMKEDGDIALIFQNESEFTDAVITCISFEIFDENLLRQVSHRDPPQNAPRVGPTQAAAPAAPIPKDDLVLRRGEWTDEGTYEFYTCPESCVVPKGQTQILQIGLVHQKFIGIRFTGRLTVEYNGKSPVKLINVTVTGKRGRGA